MNLFPSLQQGDNNSTKPQGCCEDYVRNSTAALSQQQSARNQPLSPGSRVGGLHLGRWGGPTSQGSSPFGVFSVGDPQSREEGVRKNFRQQRPCGLPSRDSRSGSPWVDPDKKGSLCYSRQAGDGLLSTVTRGLQRMMSHQIPSKERIDLSGSVSSGDSWTSGQQKERDYRSN